MNTILQNDSSISLFNKISSAIDNVSCVNNSIPFKLAIFKSEITMMYWERFKLIFSNAKTESENNTTYSSYQLIQILVSAPEGPWLSKAE